MKTQRRKRTLLQLLLSVWCLLLTATGEDAVHAQAAATTPLCAALRKAQVLAGLECLTSPGSMTMDAFGPAAAGNSWGAVFAGLSLSPINMKSESASHRDVAFLGRAGALNGALAVDTLPFSFNAGAGFTETSLRAAELTNLTFHTLSDVRRAFEQADSLSDGPVKARVESGLDSLCATNSEYINRALAGTVRLTFVSTSKVAAHAKGEVLWGSFVLESHYESGGETLMTVQSKAPVILAVSRVFGKKTHADLCSPCGGLLSERRVGRDGSCSSCGWYVNRQTNSPEGHDLRSGGFTCDFGPKMGQVSHLAKFEAGGETGGDGGSGHCVIDMTQTLVPIGTDAAAVDAPRVGFRGYAQFDMATHGKRAAPNTSVVGINLVPANVHGRQCHAPWSHVTTDYKEVRLRVCDRSRGGCITD